MSGASGMVGRALRSSLALHGGSVAALVRRPLPEASPDIPWDPYRETPVADPAALENFDAAIHRSGENLSEGRWTARHKAALRESRVVTTRRLAAMLARCQARPQVLVCASAIGWYGNRGDEILTEDSAPGEGFLADLCRDWERSAKAAEVAGIRVVHLRFGVILSREGGALRKMLPVFRLGLGGRFGSGRQWMSWISLPDAIAAIRFAIQKADLRGAVNVVSPRPVTNSAFTRTLAHAMHRPALLPVPALVLRAAVGEMADAALLSSARVLPAKLEAAGFNFQHAELETAFKVLLRPGESLEHSTAGH